MAEDASETRTPQPEQGSYEQGSFKRPKRSKDWKSPNPAHGFASTDQRVKLDLLPPKLPARLPRSSSRHDLTPATGPGTDTAEDTEPGQDIPLTQEPAGPDTADTTQQGAGSPSAEQQTEPATDSAVSHRATLPILLFDLNGTLTSHTSDRRSAGVTRVRPGIEHLAKLADKCRIGIFSSSTHRTVSTARGMLEEAAGNVAIFEPGLILHRDHTVHTPHAAGKYWDTAKPLSKWFEHLERILIFDDDDHKSLESEKSNLVLVPAWQDEDANCGVLAALADVLEAVLSKVGPEDDIRQHVPDIMARVKEVADKQQQAAEAAAAQAAHDPNAIDLDDL